jgi:cytochrome oxidase Cu insertion factor (SCO1/SenC/PrrC family)
MRTFSEGDP